MLGAIVTAFLIEARQDLTADPATINDSPTSYKKFEPTTTAWLVNAAWYSSLVLTLISALTAVLARGWLAKYSVRMDRIPTMLAKFVIFLFLFFILLTVLY